MFPVGDEDRGARGIAALVIVLVAINFLVFLYEASLDNTQDLREFITTYGVIPAEIERGEDLFTLITSMFVHGGWGHIIGNMVFLWVFGDNIERNFGPIIFILLYVLSGLLASATHIITNAGATVPSVGASGAIAGVLLRTAGREQFAST